MTEDLIPTERIANAIRVIRGQRVLLDVDLAKLYGVETRVLNQAVRRNDERFPADFMFQLTVEEYARLRSQIVILDAARGRHRKFRPYAFTEQGVAMLSGVLHSPRAVAVNVEIMRAFVELRRVLNSHADLARKLEALERRYDGQFKTVFEAIRQLMAPPKRPRRKIGFK
jgi:ORF6N domain